MRSNSPCVPLGLGILIQCINRLLFKEKRRRFELSWVELSWLDGVVVLLRLAGTVATKSKTKERRNKQFWWCDCFEPIIPKRATPDASLNFEIEFFSKFLRNLKLVSYFLKLTPTRMYQENRTMNAQFKAHARLMQGSCEPASLGWPINPHTYTK